MMKWTHLPLGGGLYDQHPKFLEDLVIIARIENKVEHERQRKREAEMKRKSAKSSGGRRAGRR